MFIDISHAKDIAFGLKPSASLDEYYDAWQYLYDNRAPLGEADVNFMDKLICDGNIITPDNRNELGGRPVRNSLNIARFLSEEA